MPRAVDRDPAPPLGLAEQTCLALVVEGVSHGWAIGSLLARSGELGRIWSLSRPLTYRAIDSLVERGLVVRRGTASGGGGERMILRPTAAGKRASTTWLARPVAHIRDIRTELLLKIALRQRAGEDLGPLLRAQLDTLGSALDALTGAVADDDVVGLWRRENARAVRRFLETALESSRCRA